MRDGHFLFEQVSPAPRPNFHHVRGHYLLYPHNSDRRTGKPARTAEKFRRAPLDSDILSEVPSNSDSPSKLSADWAPGHEAHGVFEFLICSAIRRDASDRWFDC